MLDDLRFAWRMVRKNPGFALFAVLTLAVGIGANSAIFTVVDTVLLRPLAYPHADELVVVEPTARGRLNALSIVEIGDLREQATTFTDIAAVLQFPGNLTGEGQPARVEAVGVTPTYFQILGVPAAVGRTFVASDDSPGITTIAVISDRFWKSYFRGRSDVIGAHVNIDDDPYTIVGVMPPSFTHPDVPGAVSVDLWVPCGFRGPPFQGSLTRSARFLSAIGRVKPGVDMAAARTQIAGLFARWRETYPGDYPESEHWDARVRTLAALVVGDTSRGLMILFAAVGLVLLIACTNVALLLLSRAASRRKEVSLRAALGASRGRLVRQLLTESLLLSIFGGVIGIGLALWSTDLLVAASPIALPRAGEIHVDARVLGFTAGLSIATAILFGLVPALRTARPDLQAVLNEGGRSHAAPGHRLRSILVVVEIALAMVMLTGAGLLLRSLDKAAGTDPGFDPSRIVSVELWLPIPNDINHGRYNVPKNRGEFGMELLRRVRETPGVEHAALAQTLPLSALSLTQRGAGAGYVVDGRDEPPAAHNAIISNVSEGYFETVKIPLLAGRTFDVRDGPDAPSVIIVNQALAKHVFGSAGDAVGKQLRFGFGDGKSTTIVGVVGDVRTLGLDREIFDEVYLAHEQRPSPMLTLIARLAPGAGPGAEQVLGATVRAIDRDLPVSEVRSLDDMLRGAVARRRFVAMLLALFAAAALAMAALGIYSVTSYSVSQRRHEIGVRMAIGARSEDVLRMVLGQALRAVAGGVTLGTIGALIAGRAIGGLLYGVSAADPFTFVAIGSVLGAVTLLASVLPARRAARVDPMIALRSS